MYNALRTRAISSGSGRVSADRAGSNLLRRLTGLGATGGSVSETLNRHFSERNPVDKSEVLSAVKEFRRFGKFEQALEVLEWLEMKKIDYPRPMRLDLISQTKGISAAEDYMRNLPSHEQNKFTYNALLYCYCKNSMERKALEIFEEMSQLGFVTSALPFDNLMGMYLKAGNFEKVKSLGQEMRDRNIFFSTYTYNLLMNGFAGLNDIEGVERVVERIEMSDVQRIDWTTYNNLATIYMKAGLFEKTKVALRKLEGKIWHGTRETYHYLLRLYGTIGQSDDVWRVWNVLNSVHKGFNNMSYLALIQAIDKLDDLESLKKYFQDWQSRYSSYDIRLAHVVVEACLRHGEYDEAISVFKEATTRTKVPYFKMREIFMFYYLKNDRVDSALSYLEANVSESKCLKRGEEVMTAFLNYFERVGDVDGAERVLDIVKKVYSPNSENYRSLLKIYGAAEKIDPKMRLRIEKDGVEISPEIEELLRKVCPG